MAIATPCVRCSAAQRPLQPGGALCPSGELQVHRGFLHGAMTLSPVRAVEPTDRYRATLMGHSSSERMAGEGTGQRSSRSNECSTCCAPR